MTATERFKQMLANALERICVLEAELEEAREQIAAQTGEAANRNGSRPLVPSTD